MIQSFKCRETALIFNRHYSKRFPISLQRQALKKLRMLDASPSLNTLRVPPANRLEALKGERQGQQSIRINDQYRICFCWRDGNAHKVKIVDYH